MPQPKIFLKITFVVILSFLLMAWGYNGHYKINGNASLSFTPEMEQFMSWAVILSQHASDADDRKDIDPNEGPRHYLDVDNYPGFLTGGRIPQTYDSAVALYGQAFVIDQGVLPWATHITYDSLVNSFIRFDWEKAVLFASDLGHYVADAHNPLHITRNYNGQYSGNYGVHSRYESGMINKYKDDIIYTGEDISFITDVNGYIFQYLYANYIYVDSVILADDYAQAAAGNDYSDEYKAAMWEKTGGFTIALFSRASHSLAELIYSAWVEAGKPDMNSGPGIFENKDKRYGIPLEVNPNPISEKTIITFSLPESVIVTIRIIDVYGNEIETLTDEYLSNGNHEIYWDTTSLTKGIYFLSVDAGNYKEIRKLIKIN